MSKPVAPEAAPFWHRRAAVLAAKLNFHHWLARVVPLLAGLLVLLALLEIFRRETALPARWTLAVLLSGVAIASAWAWWRARRHFCTWNQALVRLETVLGLHNQLSAAQEGVLPWPSPPPQIDDGYVSNWKQITIPLLAGSLFLWSAHLVPVSKMKLGFSSEPISKPPEFVQIQSWINTLKAEDLIQPEKLQEMQSALNKLQDRPAQDWYTQGNLEAASSLEELMEQSLNSLSHDLDQADKVVEAMKEKAGNPSDTTSLQPMQDELRKAAENLASGNLPLNKELLGQLQGAELANDKTLSAAQLEALHAQLKKGGAAMQTAAKSGAGLSKEMKDAMMAAALGQGKSGRHVGIPGSGGPGGGEQTAPLELQPRDKTTPQGAMTPVSNNDMRHAALGETLKVSASEHTVDPTAYQGPQSAGAAQVNGTGGEAVWRSTYDPQEADALSRFFK